MLCVLTAVLGLLITGCALRGPNSFTEVDLQSNLSAQDLKRYESEWQAIQASGQQPAGTCCMGELEMSDSWPLGLLLVWDRGSVMRTETADGLSYMITREWGLGPLGMLFVAQDMAGYDAQGQRVSGMYSWSLLLGHVAMVHNSDAILENGQHEAMSMGHLLMHLISFHKMEGHTQISLLTAPNPLTLNLHSGAGM
jgi:hypothetical protein